MWIGIGENKAGFADSVQPIPDAARERNRVQDALTDLIEPAPSIGSELQIDLVPIGKSDEFVLCIRVRRDRRPPYLLRQSSPPFLIRTGSRLRSMTRDEIKEAFERGVAGRGTTAHKANEEAENEVEEDLKNAAQPNTGLRFIIRPVDDLQLTLSQETLDPLLRDPTLTANRPLGWNFASRYNNLRRTRSGYQLGEIGSVQWLILANTGRIELGADRPKSRRQPVVG